MKCGTNGFPTIVKLKTEDIIKNPGLWQDTMSNPRKTPLRFQTLLGFRKSNKIYVLQQTVTGGPSATAGLRAPPQYRSETSVGI